MRNFKNFDADDFLLNLEQCDWSSITGFDDVDDMYEKWKHLYKEICDEHCPFVTRRVRTCFLRWLSEDIIDDIKAKHYYEKKAHTKGLDIYWQMFMHFRNVVLNSLKIAKRYYYTGMILENKNKPKLMWKCFKELLPGKSKPNLKGLLVNGKIITNSKGIANAYNDCCTFIGNDLVSKLPPHNPSNLTNSDQPSGIPSFHFPIIPTDFVDLVFISNVRKQSCRS